MCFGKVDHTVEQRIVPRGIIYWVYARTVPIKAFYIIKTIQKRKQRMVHTHFLYSYCFKAFPSQLRNEYNKDDIVKRFMHS